MPKSNDISAYTALLNRSLSDMSVTTMGLQIALTVMQDKLVGLDVSQQQLQQQRKNLKDDAVLSALPDFSHDTLDRLKEEYPEFVDDTVLDAFKKNRTWFGLFSNPDSTNNLTLLKARFGFFLDSYKYGYIIDYDEQIAKINQEKGPLERASISTERFLVKLDRLETLHATDREDIEDTIKSLAENSRHIASLAVRANMLQQDAQSAGNRTAHQRQMHSTYNSKMWIDMVEDNALWSFVDDEPTARPAKYAGSANSHNRYVFNNGQSQPSHTYQQNRRTAPSHRHSTQNYYSTQYIDNNYFDNTVNNMQTDNTDQYSSDNYVGDSIQTDDSLGAYS